MVILWSGAMLPPTRRPVCTPALLWTARATAFSSTTPRRNAELLKAAAEHRGYIMEATLAVAYEQGPAAAGMDTAIDERPFRFGVSRAS